MTDNTTPTEDETDDSEPAIEPAGSVDRTEIESLDLERRQYLRAVGVAGASGLGLSAGAAGSVAAEPADTSKSVDERIEEHRTGELEITVQNEDGATISNADVSITQQEHEFGFGTAVNAGTLINESGPGDNYREYIPQLFNKAVLENQTKWRFWEENQQLADDAIEWLLDQGLDVRGHVCIWGDRDNAAVPSDVETAIDNRDAQTIRERSMQHIEDIITHYGDDITEWEVVNEAMHKYDLQLGVYGDQIDTDEPWTGEVQPWTSELLADWYSKADEVIRENGLDVGIAVNDFNQFAWGYTDQRYQSEIEHLNQNAVQLDSIGLQAHVRAGNGEFNSNDDPDGRISASQVAEEINKWADYGASVKITEFDTYNGDAWNSDQERADMLENYLRGAFSHPAVDDFLMWGFWDGRHWEDEAPLFYQDWSEKPGYDVWTNLVFDEWWTDESGTTDSSGTYTTDAFLGEHEITVTADGDTATETVEVTDADAGEQVTVIVDAEGPGNGEDTIQVGEYEVQDSTGDDLYNDFDGDGDTTHDDVTAFFEHLEDDGVQNNPDAFDFDENGRIGFGDVIDLLNDV